jgi:glutaryl-CoA dehydrogenase
MASRTSPFDLLAFDNLLSEDDRALRDLVRRVVDEHVRPYVGQWFEDGQFPTRELAKRFGQIGLLGMHLHGYGCAGSSALAYGLACLELEAATRLRSLVACRGR